MNLHTQFQQFIFYNWWENINFIHKFYVSQSIRKFHKNDQTSICNSGQVDNIFPSERHGQTDRPIIFYIRCSLYMKYSQKKILIISKQNYLYEADGQTGNYESHSNFATHKKMLSKLKRRTLICSICWFSFLK